MTVYRCKPVNEGYLKGMSLGHCCEMSVNHLVSSLFKTKCAFYLLFLFYSYGYVVTKQAKQNSIKVTSLKYLDLVKMHPARRKTNCKKTQIKSNILQVTPYSNR